MAIFSKQAYLAIADAIRMQRGRVIHGGHPDFRGLNLAMLEATAHTLADRFETDNRAFNRGQFIANCGFVPRIQADLARARPGYRAEHGTAS